jgi:KDO2-lipid IV(A) lauroyltransferase
MGWGRRWAGPLLDVIGSGCSFALRLLPWRAALWIGDGLGRLAGSLPGRKKDRAEANLRSAGAADPRRSSRQAWAHASKTIIEMVWSTTRSPEQVRRHLVVEGLDSLRQAAEAGRGILLVTAHVGNWEMVGQAATLARIPVAVIARPLRTPKMERRLVAFRWRCGVCTLLRGRPGASLAAARWLRRGGLLACMIDRASSGRRVGLPFLGNITNVPLGPFELAQRSRSAVMLGWGRRRADGATLVTFRKVTNGTPGDPRETAGIVTRALEEEVRSCPEQWLWIYRRQPFWKDPPPVASADPGLLRLPAEARPHP